MYTKRGSSVGFVRSLLKVSMLALWLANRAVRQDRIAVILAARDSTLAVEYDRCHKFKAGGSDLCIDCRKISSTVSHNLASREVMSFTCHKVRHDAVCRAVLKECCNVLSDPVRYPVTSSPDQRLEVRCDQFLTTWTQVAARRHD
ncbi:hypothetical protein RF11_08444 [Thelohanellus kitauei]|uniref:Uncharacterized protein n=1 Tax=Thelohanellus kitauei TaxID=669202 RepID=A0A0C2MCT7_THEKT|nr:hypothetical protein RF11_08444 [Thelohanellus kitauei]